nr:MAG TPA: hypothetical protein [Caudoviricetes sp.]
MLSILFVKTKPKWLLSSLKNSKNLKQRSVY